MNSGHMDGGRGTRGWMAAITVACTFTLILLAVEKHLRIPSRSFWQAPLASQEVGATTEQHGILLTVDPGLVEVKQVAQSPVFPIHRRENIVEEQAAPMLRRPPEPAANVVLRAPESMLDMDSLPLHASSSNIDYLIEALDRALKSPMSAVSAQREVKEVATSLRIPGERVDLPSPVSIAGRIPVPTQLMQELDSLQQLVAALAPPQGLEFVNTRLPANSPHSLPTNAIVSLENLNRINSWLFSTRAAINRTVLTHGLEHPDSERDLTELALLASQAPALADSLTNYSLASHINRTSYALVRRVAIWQALRDCLEGPSIGLVSPDSQASARQRLLQSIESIGELLASTGDSDRWRTYLMLDELRRWAASEDDFEVRSKLPAQVLSRLHWQRLTNAQQRFLNQPQFEELASQLVVWGREPVDYRQLLTNLEQFEEDDTSRSAYSLASTVQILRNSGQANQRELATELNNHYRNANIRLTISKELIERFLPEGQYEVRPVRQRILGADTNGDSEVLTKLSVNLIPDDQAWNLNLGVSGEMVSTTRSSKGPAVFHNSSAAQITSNRYVRVDPMGYRLSSQPTNVDSQDFLRGMSTDFDGLPIIGDFVRLIVREQFNQKRGLAQRITRRIIAQEADAEFDRRLEENLQTAEKELRERMVGPLERLSLNPIVVAMNTTEDRLTVRYRVANESQIGAHTPRPRAPHDNLLSMQVHQSTINNTIEKIGLSGRTWTIAELYERLGQVFNSSDWQVPEEMLEDVRDLTLRFADHRPATVELKDGKLSLTLRIAQLRQGDRIHIERFIVQSNYVPAADGLNAELIRDGVVEIASGGGARERLTLRLIFAKVFVSRPEIPLVSKAWTEDPRAEGLAVSQVEIRDGWLAVAISEADSELAAQVAERARELRR